MNIEAPALLLAGDVFVTRGPKPFSRQIRLFTRSPGEEPTQVNHAGGIVSPGSIYTADAVESSWRVERHSLYEEYAGSSAKIAIARPIITDEQRAALATRWQSRVGESYGFFELPMHWLDYLASKRKGREVYRWRRLCRTKRSVICSTLVAAAFDEVLGWRFCGVAPNACQPDDIWDEWHDEKRGQPHRWVVIRKLLPIEG